MTFQTPNSAGSDEDGRRVHIVLCAYQPNLEFLGRQIASIRAQTHRNWTCQIRLDPGPRDCAADVQALLASDDRFSFVANLTRYGVYHNFEEGLRATPNDAAFVAYCDQDDEWVETKLSESLKAFDDPAVVLVHSDLEAINAESEQIFPSTFASEKRIVGDYSLAQLILRNAVTGCACVFRASLLRYILPFPPQGPDIAFHHDLWTALISTQLGRIATIAHPLVRYRQHGANLVGVEAAGRKGAKAPLRLQARSWQNNWVLRERLIRAVLARELPGLGEDAKRQRRELERWLHARFVNPSLWRRALGLWMRGLPAGDAALQTSLGQLVIAGKPGLSRARSLRRTISSQVQRMRLVARAVFAFALEPHYRSKVFEVLGRLEPPAGRGLAAGNAAAPLYGEQYLAPLGLTFTALVPRLVIVVPTGRVSYIFGGLTTIFKFGVALAQQGVAIRFLSIDHVLSEDDIASLKDFLRERCGFEGDWDAIEIASSGAGGAPAHPSDIFVATIWWSARRIFHTLEQDRFQYKTFYYFIQDYEPGFYAWSNEYALAQSTYGMKCRPIVNTQFLADHLLAESELRTPADRVFNPEIEWAMFWPADADEIRARPVRRLFFYGRPGTPRNLFDVGLAAIRRFVKVLDLDATSLEVISAGEAHAPIDLGRGVMMRSVGKLGMSEYAELLRSSDIGLSLMLSPHPSYPPFEMAASGLTVVTNNFGTKRMEFSANIIATNPGPEALAQALMQAWHRSPDADARIAGATIDMSSLGRPLKQLIPEIADEISPFLSAMYPAGSTIALAGETKLHYRFGFGEGQDFSSKRVCLISHFDVDNTIDPHVLNYLASLKNEGFEIVLISSNMQLDAASQDAARSLCAALIHRENRGYDFAGWALALRLFPSLRDADELLMCNDSVYGPLRALRPMFDQMNDAPCDFWGITESLEAEWHLQSYFLVFKKAALKSPAFWEFWTNVRVFIDKTELIHAYEVTLAKTLANSGLRPGVLVAFAEVSNTVCNPTLNPWRRTLTVGKSPFVKVQLLRDNPLRSDIDGWQKVVADLGYDPALIEAHLSRVRVL